MSLAPPCIEIRSVPAEAPPWPDEPLAVLAYWVDRLGAAAGKQDSHGLAAVLHSLVLEGRSFSTTPSGARWRSLLAPSSLAANGWMVWNALDLDHLLLAARPSAVLPGDQAEALVRVIGAAPLEELMRALSDAALVRSAAGSADD